MNDPLYRKEVMRLAADAHASGRLPHPDGSGQAHNPACGDRVIVDLNVADGRIAAIAQETRACVLTQASASILGERLVGATRSDVEELARSVAAMLEADAEPPAAPYGGFSALEGVRDFPARHRCVLLPFAAVLEALDELNSPEPGGVRTQR